jgi:hypothetical protein
VLSSFIRLPAGASFFELTRQTMPFLAFSANRPTLSVKIPYYQLRFLNPLYIRPPLSFELVFLQQQAVEHRLIGS